MPNIDKRYQKAERILNRPFAILQDKDKDLCYLVRAEEDPVMAYAVTFVPIYDEHGKVSKYRGECECIDYMYKSKTDIEHKCKHILAIMIAKVRGKRIKRVDLKQYKPELL